LPLGIHPAVPIRGGRKQAHHVIAALKAAEV